MQFRKVYFFNIRTILVNLLFLFVTVNFLLVKASILNELRKRVDIYSKINKIPFSMKKIPSMSQKNLFHFLSCRHMQSICTAVESLAIRREEQYIVKAISDCKEWRNICFRKNPLHTQVGIY